MSCNLTSIRIEKNDDGTYNLATSKELKTIEISDSILDILDELELVIPYDISDTQVEVLDRTKYDDIILYTNSNNELNNVEEFLNMIKSNHDLIQFKMD